MFPFASKEAKVRMKKFLSVIPLVSRFFTDDDFHYLLDTIRQYIDVNRMLISMMRHGYVPPLRIHNHPHKCPSQKFEDIREFLLKHYSFDITPYVLKALREGRISFPRKEYNFSCIRNIPLNTQFKSVAPIYVLQPSHELVISPLLSNILKRGDLIVQTLHKCNDKHFFWDGEKAVELSWKSLIIPKEISKDFPLGYFTGKYTNMEGLKIIIDPSVFADLKEYEIDIIKNREQDSKNIISHFVYQDIDGPKNIRISIYDVFGQLGTQKNVYIEERSFHVNGEIYLSYFL